MSTRLRILEMICDVIPASFFDSVSSGTPKSLRRFVRLLAFLSIYSYSDNFPEQEHINVAFLDSICSLLPTCFLYLTAVKCICSLESTTYISFRAHLKVCFSY
jgi:hypothetical protein